MQIRMLTNLNELLDCWLIENGSKNLFILIETIKKVYFVEIKIYNIELHVR